MRPRGFGGIAVALVLVVLGAVLAFLPSGGDEVSKSVLTTGPDGRRGLYLLLDELGLETRVFAEAPAELPRGDGLLWLPREPELPELVRELADLEDMDGRAASTLAPHDPAHYRRFVEEGGTLVLPMSEAGMPEFLRDVFDVELPEEAPRGEREGGLALARLVATDETLELSRPTWFRPEFVEGLVRARVELVEAATDDPSGREPRAALLSIERGRGTLLLAATDEVFENGRLREGDHGLLALRIARELAGGGPVLFDEYALGRWAPGTVLGVAASPRLALLTAHVLALLAVLAWWLGWVGPFPRDERPAEPLSALARARSTAGLLLRAGRPDLLARRMREGELRALARRAPAGRAPRRGDRDVEPAALLGESVSEDELARWEESLDPQRVRSAVDLESYEQRLARFAERIRSGRVQAAPDDGIMVP